MAAETALLTELTALLGEHGVAVHKTPVEVSSTDALFVIDMQNDFVPGGSFGVAEGHSTVEPIKALLSTFASKDAPILASRDYHPVNHCSFATHGGPFPPHCVQGSKGSHFVEGLEAPLSKLLGEEKAHVVFKGFSRDIDSFGAVTYPETEAAPGGRLSCNAGGKYCAPCWTGGFVLFCSQLQNDCNAPPDVMSILDRKTVGEALEGAKAKKLFVCGLAFDFCVLDTALNAAKAGYTDVSIVVDASRAAHIPGVGTFGTGFLSDPAKIAQQLKERNIKLVHSASFA